MQAPHLASPTDVELLEELGRGAHSVVYRARKGSRYLAVKMPLYDDEEHLERVAQSFLREATALARVRHPALPAVMEVGWREGVPYLVMELVTGETLASRLRQGPLDEPTVLEVALQLCEALHSIHQCGLIHRDISPANVLFDAHTGAVRLVDFGFAQNAPLDIVQTTTPVQSWRGHVVAAEIDLFALGCVLFECVTAVSPFSAVDPRPLLERSGDHQDLQPRLSKPLARILRRLLHLESGTHYVDAAALLDDLRPFGRGPRSSSPTSQSSHQLVVTLPTVLVGRERELDRLRLAWRTSSTRQTQVVLVRGGSGTGKTRLIKAFVDELAQEKGSCFVFKCNEAQLEPFAWVRRLVHGYLARFENLDGAEEEVAIDAFCRLVGDAAPLLRVLSTRLARLLPDTGRAPPGDGGEEIFAEGLADVVLKLLNELAPSTVVIDDVQWLDQGSRRVLACLSEREGSRTLIVLTARDDEDHWARVGQLTRSLNSERVWELSLEPFPDALVGRLIDAYLGHQPYDAELLRFVSTISDRTPLSVLEILRALLESGALVPNWGRWRFDAVRAARQDIPRSGVDLIARRVADLTANTLQVLSAAAVLGTSFHHSFLACACTLSEQTAAEALAEARGALLVEPDAEQHRFAHDSVREAVLARLTPEKLRQLHQRIGDALRSSLDQQLDADSRQPTPAVAAPSVNASLIYSIASHYAAGMCDEHPERVLESCTAAGRVAFHMYDNQSALRYLLEAEQAAARLSISLPEDVQLLLAEAQLRIGEVEASLRRFADITESATDPVTRAHTLSRIAFAQAHHDRTSAWQALERAFQALDERPPSGTVLALLLALCWWLYWLVWPLRPVASDVDRRRLEVLCGLYYHAARLSIFVSKAGHVFEVTLRGLAPGARLGPSDAMCRSYILYSFLLTAIGAKKVARKYLARAEAAAAATGDPLVYSYVLQGQGVVLAWAGDLGGALRAGARSLTEYGSWRELSEFCITAYNQQQIERLRGRCRHAWKMLELAVARLSQHEGTPVTVEYIEDSARAALMALGRERETDAVLRRLKATQRERMPRAIAGMVPYGSDVRLFTECGRFDDAFEAFVESIKAKRFNPKRVHLEMTEYYVHLAHARVHGVLRAPASDRDQALAKLREALSNLKQAARIPLLKAHATVVEAFLAFFNGKQERCQRLLDRAQDLGRAEAAPWVLYAVHRAMAHLARARGEVEAALDQARMAEALAKEYGAVYLLRWIREEFQLRAVVHHSGEDSALSSSGDSTLPAANLDGGRGRSRAYLRALVRIDQQTDLSRTRQAQVVIDELIDTLSADRGVLFLAPSWPEGAGVGAPEAFGEAHSGIVALPGVSDLARRLHLVAARNGRRADVEEADFDTALIEDLFAFGDADDVDGTFERANAYFFKDRTVLAVPLIMRRERVGVVYLDRPRRLWPFSDRDRETLLALADQIPLVFELGRSLRARGRAEQNQRSAEKLEAVGRLAGGIAHDFNNMLSVIVSSTEQVLKQDLPPAVVEETTTIQSAATRARDLTRQLLSFSRGQYLNLEVVELNALIRRLEPIFRRLIGGSRLELDLDDSLCKVEVDPAQVDQVLTNLVVNAGDAMVHAGLIRIQTRTI